MEPAALQRSDGKTSPDLRQIMLADFTTNSAWITVFFRMQQDSYAGK
jgi:hypothetical protein